MSTKTNTKSTTCASLLHLCNITQQQSVKLLKEINKKLNIAFDMVINLLISRVRPIKDQHLYNYSVCAQAVFCAFHCRSHKFISSNAGYKSAAALSLLKKVAKISRKRQYRDLTLNRICSVASPTLHCTHLIKNMDRKIFKELIPKSNQ